LFWFLTQFGGIPRRSVNVYFLSLLAKAALTSHNLRSVPEIIDPVFAKTSQNARFLLSENERFGLVFVKTGSINSGTELCMTTVSDAYRYKGISAEDGHDIGLIRMKAMDQTTNRLQS
jgi:hypothetical protein